MPRITQGGSTAWATCVRTDAPADLTCLPSLQARGGPLSSVEYSGTRYFREGRRAGRKASELHPLGMGELLVFSGLEVVAGVLSH